MMCIFLLLLYNSRVTVYVMVTVKGRRRRDLANAGVRHGGRR